jgi:hypothetical protein
MKVLSVYRCVVISYVDRCCVWIDDGLIRAETCREYRSYLIKTLSIVAKQKVLLFTVNITPLGRYSSLADSDHGICFLFC